MGQSELPRKCVVTVGATATFPDLVDEVSTYDFLLALQQAGFTRLEIQCGADQERVSRRIHEIGKRDQGQTLHLKVAVLSHDPELWRRYVDCRGRAAKGQAAGVVIGHAGTGTVSEVTGRQVPLIIVPNPKLMDNHQAEFAETIAETYPGVVLGRLGNLKAAVPQILDKIDKGGLDDLPAYVDPPFPAPDGRRFTLLDWTVLTCYPEELEAQARAAGAYRRGDMKRPQSVLEKEQVDRAHLQVD